MHQSVQGQQRGSYTANLLGNIRSHLAGLQGYDVMALELVQNADDAKAQKIVFDITDDGLVVHNSGKFSYCGDLNAKPCVFQAKQGGNAICDYHRIIDVGSGGKLLQNENIGRFGIGFLSAYQITDRPEIRSSGIKLTLIPEEGEWSIEELSDEPAGTTFFLPWARKPDTRARVQLGVSHIEVFHIDQVATDLKRVLRQSLLFLRHVRSAEVWRHGALLLACDLDRSDEPSLSVRFRPSGEIEKWHILRADAAKNAEQLCKTYSRLAGLKRSTEIGVGLRIEPELLSDGLLYAFLPTKQSSGLPLHINADFFPAPNRKEVIFDGDQHEQAWNEMLIKTAAEKIARDPEGLLDMLGPGQFWKTLSKAFDLISEPSAPRCYKHFWECTKATATEACIVQVQDGSIQQAGAVFLPPNPLTTEQADALLYAGGRLASEKLRPFQVVMGQLGAKILTLKRTVDLLSSVLSARGGQVTRVDEGRVKIFYKPLWRLVNDLLPESNTVPYQLARRLESLPFVVTEDLCLVTIDRAYAAPKKSMVDRIAALLPGLTLASRDFLEFPKLGGQVQTLNLAKVVSHIGSRITSEPAEDVIGTGSEALGDFYGLFPELDDYGTANPGVYKTLADLPIWRSGSGLVKATEALLPGDFIDPTGQANLLDTSVLSDRAREFVSTKLGIKTQTVDAYVEKMLPNFFDEQGPIDSTKYQGLITELAKHSVLIDEDGPRQILGSLPIIPTQDGGWSRPDETYRRSEALVQVLGDAAHLWLDENRLPDVNSVHNFVDGIGILQSATPRHLVDRILDIADGSPPTDDAKRASSEAFYELCQNYEAWKEKAAFQEAITDLRSTDCLPVDGDPLNWHSPDSLYAPFQADAFRSQAKILKFRDTKRLKTEMLRDLGIKINPSTQLVIDHLKHCMERGIGPHKFTYQVLNEPARVSDPLVAKLKDTQCIYVENKGEFVRTNQVYWGAQQLGEYAFRVPDSMKPFAPLFKAIGVKDAPECSDYVAILIDIAEDHFKRFAPVVDADRVIYDTCLDAVATAYEQGECGTVELQRLGKAPAILNLADMATLPDEVLLYDSEWYANFFGGELDRALCKLPAGVDSLATELGVKKLSESASVSLEYVHGEERDETELAEKLVKRKDVFARLLHDEQATVRNRVCTALSVLKAVSYDAVHIKASIQLTDDFVSAPPVPAPAFYEIEEGLLTIRRPVDNRNWAHILNAIFHQWIPEATGSEISKLTALAGLLMEKTTEGAHDYLTDTGMPQLDEGRPVVDAGDLASQELGELGASAEQIDERQMDEPVATVEDGELEAEAPDVGPRDSSHEENQGTQGSEVTPIQRKDVSVPGGQFLQTKENPRRKKRPKYKEQWDRRLLSYVRRVQEESSEGGQESMGPSEHNLAVEFVARAAVCTYEKERGRIAKQMAQTNPGYDITSHDPLTGEDRIIEVKGIMGEWNQTGVGLSRTQFSNAQDCGDRYWLYVVENVSNPDHVCIHPIRNPAMQVTSFMFDGNWREAATDEMADPTKQFIPGVRIQHQVMGTGKIVDVDVRGSTKLLTIRFDGKNQDIPNVPLNLHQMHILQDDDGDDNS